MPRLRCGSLLTLWCRALLTLRSSALLPLRGRTLLARLHGGGALLTLWRCALLPLGRGRRDLLTSLRLHAWLRLTSRFA